MRFVRVLLIAAVCIVAAGCKDAVANSAGVFVEVSPTTIQPGSAVGIRASCGDEVNPATVSSPVFGSITIQPVNGILTSTAQVPPTATGGSSKVTLTCKSGSKASTTLTVLGPPATPTPAPTASPQPTMGPNTGGGFLAQGGRGGLTPGSLVWFGVGLSGFAGAIAVGLRSKRRATIRARRTPR